MTRRRNADAGESAGDDWDLDREPDRERRSAGRRGPGRQSQRTPDWWRRLDAASAATAGAGAST